MLVDTRGEHVVRHHAGTTECDAVPGDVEKDVSRLENYTSQSIGLFVGYEREPGMIETAVEDILAAHKSVSFASWQISVCTTLWCRPRADLGRDFGERNNGPTGVVLDGGLTRHTQAP